MPCIGPTVKGSGFSVSSGQVTVSTPSTENILVSNTGKNLADGSVTVDLKRGSGPYPQPIVGIVVRYQDNNNFYWLNVTPTTIVLNERNGGTDNTRGTTSVSNSTNVYYRFRIDVTGGVITVYRDGIQQLTWTDTTPWTSGRVGLLHTGTGAANWDNVVATTNVNPATVASYDDFDAWGMTLEGRSAINGDNRQRFRFTGKERDVESGYDYFGARYFDARIGRLVQVDPHLGKCPSLTPYCYVGNNPLGFLDLTGMDSTAAGSSSMQPTSLQAISWPVFNASVGVMGTVGVNVASHVEANVGVSIDPNKLYENTRFYASSSLGGMIGVGVAAYGGIQFGGGLSSEPISAGTSEQISSHSEIAVGIEKVAGGSVDVALKGYSDGPVITGVSAATGKGMAGGGMAGYVGTGLMYTKTTASPSLTELGHSIIDLLSSIKIPQVMHGH